ncbi:TlpA family protein disulfide reductase [Lysobacter enzymogenes]|uniref:TlpA family protein disulfide reductase n=1 Tax=Lysobacter enzymogenes TaxID=69 RepID=UPI001A979136|nr:TlpA disulfide reductase family protein [Lysobacter enzymogenes]QQP95584.1 TlpA family protein disulfide reductase [Lysobacter enzymogenes]
MAIPSSVKVIAVAVAAGALGLLAGQVVGGGGWFARTELGQRMLQAEMKMQAPKPPADLAMAERGQPIPVLRLPDLAGQSVELPKAYAGRPMLINVWASWCGPCIKEMPELDRYARSQGAGGTQVVGIALDNADDVTAFLQRVPVHYPILLDAPGPRDAGVQLGNPKGVLPYSVLVGADGRLLKQRIGPFVDGEIDGWAQ